MRFTLAAGALLVALAAVVPLALSQVRGLALGAEEGVPEGELASAREGSDDLN
ncbi:hypothetical protein [Streptomyces sp. ISL-94]|uniref:hypothetical protein n=1 Tax=Streptomyces sp. ISL-94 TaxID=2819190 RepID=UPI001BEB644C|nr:hypothetical protein [Streptomyces sp. ISL-94]MBT2480109.1 hypothetical protein [Streptomyces sp. ISL-94]